MKKIPNKTFGQNFLTSEQAVKKIIETAELKPGNKETVLEIGPGTGNLTKALLKTGAKVIAIEKDTELVEELKKQFQTEIQTGHLTLIAEDFLEYPLSSLPKKYKTVANIPYYITGQIIRKLLSANNQPELAVVLVQKEVAERIARSKKESLLSLSVKVYGQPKLIQTVKAGSFYPKPKVDSAILKIENISKNYFKGLDEKTFFEMLKRGFAQKRKLAKNNLGLTEENLSDCGLPTNARCEDIPLENWQCLYKHYANKK